MSADVFRSEPALTGEAPVALDSAGRTVVPDGAQAAAEAAAEAGMATARSLARVRVAGGASVEFARRGASTYPADVSEHDGYRVRFPLGQATAQAVLINTGGGLVGGDRADIAVTVRGGAAAEVTSQAAERVYRSLGPSADVNIGLNLGPLARLAWLPQETILYSGARLQRRLTADVTGDATLLIVEMIVFGRLAMGETVETGSLDDQWRIRRDGRLVFAEAVRLDGPLRALMDRSAIANGARAAATILLVSPNAADRLEGARAALGTPRGLAAAGSWNGLLAARFLGHRAEDVRADVVRLATWLNDGILPRAWSQ